MTIEDKNDTNGLLKKGDVVVLRVIKDQKGKLCFEHVFCDDDPILPGEAGDRTSVRIFSPRRNGIYDFSFGDVWRVRIIKIHRTDIFMNDDRRAIYIRVHPMEKITTSITEKNFNQ